MDDLAIVNLYWDRNTDAIKETQNKYGKLIIAVAYRILGIIEDAVECENDTYLKTWNSIPDARPDKLGAYTCKISRNLAIDLYDKKNAAKRGAGSIDSIIDDMHECIPDNTSSIDNTNDVELGIIISDFLKKQSVTRRRIFIKRYFVGLSIDEIADDMELTKSNVKMSLMRMRKTLKEELQ